MPAVIGEDGVPGPWQFVREGNGRGNLGAPEQEVLLHVLHGHAAWAPGQLDGEIRADAWTWAAEIGPRFALGGDAHPATQHEQWERAVQAVAAQRHAERAAVA